MNELQFKNPFRPGSGHAPPYLAGRIKERAEFIRLLDQDIVLENLILTGLRGVGKTVLLDTFRPLAIQKDWLWCGTDLSETASVSEDRIVLRMLTDLSVVTSNFQIGETDLPAFGFNPEPQMLEHFLDFETLTGIYENTPGLPSDKLKKVLETVWAVVSNTKFEGIIFAYDEAQTMADHASKEQYPLSLMLDVFQSIQKKEIPFQLILTGLPTLFPKLVEARTYSERMFHVEFLDRLSHEESKEAITKPTQDKGSPVVFTDKSIELIVEKSGGYPYFIQFICREAYDVFTRYEPETDVRVPMDDITRKLDTDFFAGRWARA